MSALAETHSVSARESLPNLEHDNCGRFVNVFAEQAKAISDLFQTAKEAVEAARQATRVAESATVVAQNNQNATSDLVEELCQAR